MSNPEDKNVEAVTLHWWIICRDCCEAWPYDERDERDCECDEDHTFVVAEVSAAALTAAQQPERQTARVRGYATGGNDPQQPERPQPEDGQPTYLDDWIRRTREAQEQALAERQRADEAETRLRNEAEHNNGLERDADQLRARVEALAEALREIAGEAQDFLSHARHFDRSFVLVRLSRQALSALNEKPEG